MLVFFAMRWSLADQYRVPTGSMQPTIEIGDHVLVDKMAYNLKLPFTNITIAEMGKPMAGDIIVFKYPKDPTVNYVKRLIAVPGDHVKIVDGFVKVNGQITLKDALSFASHFGKLSRIAPPFTYAEEIQGRQFTVQRLPNQSWPHHFNFIVPKDQYFFMGDNRDNSADSRIWGFVSKDLVVGRVHRVAFSVAFDELIPKVNFARFGKKLM